jgi:hypothetical protein
MFGGRISFLSLSVCLSCRLFSRVPLCLSLHVSLAHTCLAAAFL